MVVISDMVRGLTSLAADENQPVATAPTGDLSGPRKYCSKFIVCSKKNFYEERWFEMVERKLAGSRRG